MNVQITHVVVHTPEQVREIMREALVIAGELSDDAATRDFLFGKACELLGQRYTFAGLPQAVSLPLGPPIDIRARH